MGRILRSAMIALCVAPIVANAADRSVLFVLDASGSMWGQVEGKSKIEIARDTMDNAVGGLDENTDVGLMTYGHRRKGDCNDIELVSPVGQPRDSLLKSMKGLNPKGKTPLAASLTQAVNSLKQVEGAASVVLVSDGLETCGGDPCAAAKAAVESDVDMNVHVIGFDVTDEEARQLQCIADNGNGKYFTAANAAQLSDAFTEIAKAPPPESRTIKAKESGTGTIRYVNQFKELHTRVYSDADKAFDEVMPDFDKDMPNDLKVRPGTYRISIGQYSMPIEVRAGEVTEIAFGAIRVVNSPSVNEVLDPESGKYLDKGWGHETLVVPAGIYQVQVPGGHFEKVEVKVGELTDLQIGIIRTREKIYYIDVVDPDSGRKYGDISNGEAIGVLPGKYRLKGWKDSDMDMVVEVGPGEELVIE